VGYVEQTFACSTLAWHAFFFQYDGTNMVARLDNGSWSTPQPVVAGFNGSALSSTSWRFGSSGFSAVNVTFDGTEGFLSKTQLTRTAAGDFDNYYSYLKAQYPAAALP
jgi:hypothetical protein